MKYLVIAEKPSVSKSIAKVIGAYRQEDGYLEGGDCVVSWCLGHLAEYAAPEHYDERYENWCFEDLPILPAEWKLLVHNTKKPQFNVLRKLLRSKKFDYVVNACDAGREGEAIFRCVYALAGSKLPIKRLWISSMEDAAIQQGFENLKDGAAYDNLFAASECRAKADWLIGMNGTRAFTKKYGRKQTIGRVQTPTLAMLTERQTKIQNFVKEPYYKVELFGAGVVAVSEQMVQEQDADTVQAACDGQCAVVGSIERKRVEKKPPKLYDLTTLQREANRYYGIPGLTTSIRCSAYPSRAHGTTLWKSAKTRRATFCVLPMHWQASKEHCRRWNADWKTWNSSWRRQGKKPNVLLHRKRNWLKNLRALRS